MENRLQELTLKANTAQGYLANGEQKAMVPFIAFGQDAYSYLSEKAKYTTADLYSDIKSAGCELEKSQVYLACQAGKVLAQKHAHQYPCGSIRDLKTYLPAFGKLPAYKWRKAFTLARQDNLDSKSLLARFGIVSKVKNSDASEKETEAPQLTGAGSKYDKVVAGKYRDSHLDVNGLIRELESTLRFSVWHPPVDTQETQAKVDLQIYDKVQLAWRDSTKSLETMVDPLSGAVIAWETEYEIPASVLELNKATQKAELQRQKETEQLEIIQTARKEKRSRQGKGLGV
jgi:hypothetical protein